MKKNLRIRRILTPFLKSKIGKIMRLTFLFLLLGLLQLSASTYSQNTKLNLEFKDASVTEVLQAIESQSKYRFAYSSEFIDLDRKVNVKFENQTIGEILKEVFKDTNVKHEVEDRHIMLYTVQENEVQQAKDVSGKVTDSSGYPLPGVSIVIKGTANGTITDFDGNFDLSNVANDAILVFSFVGMKTQEINVAGQSSFNIIMVEDAIGLEEVVAIGYGTVKKSEITGSVGVVTADDLAQQPSVNPLQNLRGKLAGVTVFSNSGAPGGNNRILIRGMGTINASTQPLYVVDGVQTDNIDYLNPSDIESMEVLKDASSAAIYGARGANGVVLITTQGGLERKGLAVEYKSNFSISKIAKKRNSMYRPMNSEEFMEVQRIAVENATYFKDYTPGNEPKLVLDNDLLFDAQGNPLYDTDWEKEATRAAFSHDHHLSIRSSGDNSSTGLFLNYTDQNGIILNSYMRRADVKFAYDAALSEWLSVGTVLRLNHIWENVPDVESGNTQAIVRTFHEFPPIFPIKWPDGTWSNSTQTQGTSLILEGMPNPVSVLEDVKSLHDRTNIIGNAFADIKITPELTLRSQFGIVNKMHKFRYYAPNDVQSVGKPDGNARIENSTSTFWQNENFLTYDKEFNTSRLNAVLGASWQGFTTDESWIRVYGFKNNFFKYNKIDVAENANPPRSDYNDWSMNSYFFRANYTYKDKYSITATGRMDGSSRFGANNKYAFFPSGGLSWFLSEEDFMSGFGFIDLLRLRASYGVTGNTEIGSYNSLATISSGTNLIGGSLNSTSSVTRLANPDLRWEKSSQVNLGLNLRAFNNVLTLEADYYYKLTTDLLLGRPVPSTTGFTSITDNIGEVSNRGIDLLLTTKNIETSKFKWTSTLSVNYNKNRVEALGENDEDVFPGPYWVGGSQTILRVGEPVSSFWGQVREGTYGTDEADLAAQAGKLPGQVKRSNEKQIIGKGLPDYRGSIINRFKFGQFDAIVDLQFSYGADIMQQFVTTAEDRQALTNGIKTQLYDSWTPDNQNTPITIIRHTVLSGQDLAVDSHWIVDGSYLRGNLISLGYTFKESLLNKWGIKYLRVNASVENAFVIVSDDFKGYDPESDGMWDNSNFGQNIFFYSYPKARTFSLGLNVKF